MAARVTYTLRSASGLKFMIIATGQDYQAAKAEADAKLALSVGTVISATRSEDIEANDWGTPAPKDTPYSRAIIILHRNYDEPNKTIELTHATTEIVDQVRRDGVVNVRHELVKALAAAYRDGQGNGDYTAINGEFLRKGQKRRAR